MPVHQILVVPVSEETTSHERNSSRARNKSKKIQMASFAHEGVQNRSSSPSCPEISSTANPVQSGQDQPPEIIPPQNTLDRVSLAKRQVKRCHRRQQKSSGCISACADRSKPAGSHTDSSSGEEQHRREARSWSHEKARRRQRKRMLAQSREDKAQKEDQRRTSISSEELESNAANEGRGCNGSKEEKPILKTYEEQGAEGKNMAMPLPQKYTEVSNQNGATQEVQTDDELEVCRICHCEGNQECPLISPCRCTGSLRFVHHACLHQWIQSSDTRCCELCKYDFIMETHLKPLCKWENLQMSPSEHRKIFCSVIFHLVAMACAFLSFYFLMDRITQELRHRTYDGSLDLSSLAATGLLDWLLLTKLGLVAASVAGGFIFMYIQGKVYLQLWRRLKAFNRIVFVQNCPDSVPNEIQTGAPAGGAEAKPV